MRLFLDQTKYNIIAHNIMSPLYLFSSLVIKVFKFSCDRVIMARQRTFALKNSIKITSSGDKILMSILRSVVLYYVSTFQTYAIHLDKEADRP